MLPSRRPSAVGPEDRLRFCPNIHFMYAEHPFLDRFEAARADGFAAVEMTFPYDVPAQAVHGAAEAAGVEVVEFNLPPGLLERGVQRGLAAVPGAEGAYRDQVVQGIAYAEALGCRQLLTLAGLVPPGADRARAQFTFVSNLRVAAALCEEAQITLLVETHNSREHPGYFLTSTGQLRELLATVDRSNLRVLFDFYHVQVEEGDVTRRFLSLLDLIGHVQVAAPPDRCEPGRGELDHSHVFSLIAGSGYRGWIGGEFHPSTPTTSASLGWMRAHRWLPAR